MYVKNLSKRVRVKAAPNIATTSASTLVIPPFLAYDQPMRFLAAITLLVLAMTLAHPASAQRGIKITAKQLEVLRTEKRVALVIGNDVWPTAIQYCST